MKKKLPVVSKPMPAASQRELAVKPVAAGSKPEFPTRGAMYRQAGLIGGATLLAGGIASADAKAPAPPPPPPQQQAKQAPTAPNPPNSEMQDGSIDGQPLAKTAPKFKVYREGGGIGPAEDMWQEADVEAFINWTMAKEGKLNIHTNYKFEYEGVSFDIDGFDPDKNVGYEYVDKLDYDKDYFTKEVRAKFDKWMKDKKVAILFVEIKKNPDTATIKGKVLKFLAAVKKAPPAAGKLAGGTAEVAAPPPAKAPPPPPMKK
jgi:hypothetical protein